MTDRIVTTQAELDAALADSSVDWIEIRSERGVWIEVSSTGSATVRAYGSATVSAYDSATVSAFDSASVSAYDSATVRASGSATVRAYGSATVRAFDSATVRAFGSASVSAFDSASVRASGSASVSAFDSASVSAFGSASVSAGSHVAVHLHSGRARVAGGVLIDHAAVDQSDPQTWCTYHDVRVDGDTAYLFKAVNDQWTTSRGVDYSPGSTPSADDWRDDAECGHGLHFGPTPHHSLAYHSAATRFVRVGVDLATLRPILGGDTAKAKAPRVTVAAVAVDIDGREVDTTAATKEPLR